MKKGFTLIELLAVIIVLGVITVIAIPSVNKAIKKGKEQLYEVQIKNIELGAKSWAAENAFDLPDEDGQVITLTLGQLKVAGFVELDVKNPVTDKLFPNDMEVTITRQMNNFLYDVLEDSGSSTGDEDNIDLYSPTIILSGSASVYIEFGETYVEPGYTARNSSGVDITDQVTYEIKSNNSVVPSVDTTRFGQYKITYTVVDNERNASVIRTVTVEDTTAPELTIPSNITISDSEVATFDVMDGVSATDNSGEEVTITTSGNLSSISGTYTITYTATDIKGNETVKTRTIIVEHVIMYADTSGASAPELTTGMIPVKWNGTNWIKADVNNVSGDAEWYDYDAKIWANAVTVTSANRTTYQNAAAGTTIPMGDINTMWVWIPRYKYAIPVGTGPREINIVFESKDTTKSTGDATGTNYKTHPAFTFGTEEIDGIWVGKFETTGTIDIPTILPNVTSLKSQTVKSMYDSAKNNVEGNTPTYGFSTDGDVHMMKDSEWGVVAYLSHSKYGKNSEIWINNNQLYVTGCSGNSASEGNYNGCQNEYHTTIGGNASTTGNIYGIYDMNGGSMEYVMAINRPTDSTSIRDLGDFNAGTSDGLLPDAKYWDRYITTDASTACGGSMCYGNALVETSGWYDDRSEFVNAYNPWALRGGGCYSIEFGGIFSYNKDAGYASSTISFRLVQIKQ